MNARRLLTPGRRRARCVPISPSSERTLQVLGACAISAALLASVLPSHAAEAAPARAAVASNIVLTAAQREKLHVETLKSSTFRRTIETTGTVGFDSDHATTILAPVSGPVSRLAVSLGAKVNAGDVLATVASPDYATAISAYRKAVTTAKNARRIADLAKELSHNNLARKEVEQALTDAQNGRRGALGRVRRALRQAGEEAWR